MNYYRKPWSGWKDGGNDLAIATFWQNQTFSTSSDPVVDRRSYARIWLGSDPAGNWQYSLGYGKHYTSDADGSLHYGYNTITNETYVNYYWTKPTNSNNNDICPGDSGGPTGYWHDGLFAIHGINSASYCGKTSASTGQPLWGSLFHRAAYHSAWIGGLVGSCRYINLYSSQATVMQCFP